MNKGHGHKNVKSARRAKPSRDYFDGLPTELLTAVFTLACGSEGLDEHECDVKTRDVLSSVSRRWRAIVQSMHALWTTIWTTPPEWNLADEYLEERFTVLASRPGATSHLHIVWHFPFGISDDSHERLVSQIFLQAPAKRWKRLTLRDTRPRPAKAHLNSLSFDALETITILFHYLNGDYPLIDLILKLGAPVRRLVVKHNTWSMQQLEVRYPTFLPSLRVLETAGSTTLMNSTYPGLQSFSCHRLPDLLQPETFPNLRRLTVHHFLMPHLQILSSVPLQYLHIKTMIYDLRSMFVTHPTLEELEISNAEPWLLYLMVLPALKTLRLGGSKVSPHTSAAYMVSMLEEPQYSLSPSNAVINIPITVKILAWFLRRSEQLEHLDFLVNSTVFQLKEFLATFIKPRYLTSLRLKLCWDHYKPIKTSRRLESLREVDWIVNARKILALEPRSSLESVTIEWKDGYAIEVRA